MSMPWFWCFHLHRGDRLGSTPTESSNKQQASKQASNSAPASLVSRASRVHHSVKPTLRHVRVISGRRMQSLERRRGRRSLDGCFRTLTIVTTAWFHPRDGSRKSQSALPAEDPTSGPCRNKSKSSKLVVAWGSRRRLLASNLPVWSVCVRACV